jgi:ferredoxin-NADP reductase
MQNLIQTRVAHVSRPASDIVECVLVAAGDGVLPPFLAGAHIDVHIEPDLVRQYSLVGSARPDAYTIAVKVDSLGRGGSLRLSQVALPGAAFAISPPRNHFALVTSERRKVLIAGGIGITPVLSMARELRAVAAGAPWELHYAFGDRGAAYLPDDLAESSGNIFLYETQAGRRLVLPELLQRLQEPVEIYACGPERLMRSLEELAAAQSSIDLHLERFAGVAADPGAAREFKIRLVRSGKELHVGANETILDVVRAAGIAAPHSCMQGVCGECETRILGGRAVHRDVILSEAERAAGASMMICCSRAEGELLVLDL